MPRLLTKDNKRIRMNISKVPSIKKKQRNKLVAKYIIVIHMLCLFLEGRDDVSLNVTLEVY